MLERYKKQFDNTAVSKSNRILEHFLNSLRFDIFKLVRNAVYDFDL